MKIEVSESPVKAVTFWLTNEEKSSSQLKSSLKEQYVEWKSKGYLPVVFESGNDDIKSSMKQLISHNTQVLANSRLSEDFAG